MAIVSNEFTFAVALYKRDRNITIGAPIKLSRSYFIDYDVTIKGPEQPQQLSFEADNYGFAIEAGATVRIQDNLILNRNNNSECILRITRAKCILNSIQIINATQAAILVYTGGIAEIGGDVEINDDTGKGICCRGGSVFLKDAAEIGRIKNKVCIEYGALSIEGRQRVSGLHLASPSTVPAITGALPSDTKIQLLESEHIQKDNLPVAIAKASDSYPVLTKADGKAFVPPATFESGQVYPNATGDQLLLDNGIIVNEASISLIRIG